MSYKKSRFMAGVAFGATVAGGIALLFAPKAGEELRGDIAMKADEISKALDKKIVMAKNQATSLSGDARASKLELIAKAELLKNNLADRGQEFSKSKKKITKIAAREADKMIQEGKALIGLLDVHSISAMTDVKKFTTKASRATDKVIQAATKEVQKDIAKFSPTAAKPKK